MEDLFEVPTKVQYLKDGGIRVTTCADTPYGFLLYDSGSRYVLHFLATGNADSLPKRYDQKTTVKILRKVLRTGLGDHLNRLY